MNGQISMQAVAAGLLAGFVGFASSFAVVVQGLAAVGASPAQVSSGLMALSIAMGLCAVVLSLRSRMPISIAWSTPGAALLATSGSIDGGFPAAVGAFIVCALGIILAGLWKPLGRWVSAIPAPLANAMLAGVLLGLCLAPVRAVAEAPAMGLAIVVTWAVVAKWRRIYAVPAAVLVTALLIALTTELPAGVFSDIGPAPVLVMPEFTAGAIVGIALPLFLVTMASQNIPGIAILNINGYRPPAGPLFTATGIFSLLAAPFGAHAVNLAAITAALCAGPEAGADPSRRWWAAATSGLAYILFGFVSAAATAFIAASPPVLIQAVAGLALLGAFGSALMGAVSEEESREAAICTFLVTASGLTIAGISGAFWGLLAGGAILAWTRWCRPA